MTRVRAAVPLGLLGLAACGPSAGTDPAEVVVDSAFVDVLAEVHLADARAALAPDSLRRPAIAESLRAVALAAHHVTAEAFEARLRAWAADPAVAVAHYDALDARLGTERHGVTPTVAPAAAAPATGASATGAVSTR